MGRFINSDSQLNTSLGILGGNVFAYCLNNPCKMIEIGGNKPGELFDTVNAAAIDFGKYIGEKSIMQNLEYSSCIYSVKITEIIQVPVVETQWYNWYSWTTTTYDYQKVIRTKYSYKLPMGGFEHSSFISPLWGVLPNHIATLHTHGGYNKSIGKGNNIFSDPDKKLSQKKKMPFYLVTPSGVLRKYDPTNGSDIMIYANLPVDPNYSY